MALSTSFEEQKQEFLENNPQVRAELIKMAHQVSIDLRKAISKVLVDSGLQFSKGKNPQDFVERMAKAVEKAIKL